MDDVRIERILRAAECIPTGFVATYGDLGAICGENPRIVGAVMARWGSNVPWWRVCNAQGEIAGHFNQAHPHWQDEGLTLNKARTGANLTKHRVNRETLESAWQEAVADLEGAQQESR